MSKINYGPSILVCFTLTLMVILTLPKPASANIWSAVDAPGLMQSSCPSGAEAESELSQFKSKIAAAETIIQAKEMAVAPADMALEALKNANAILPFSDDLRKAETRLSKARSRILLASSQQQVADAFSGIMLAGLDDDSAARVSVGNESCNYSTGEVIAIVIGLILGIIPGLILLVVLC